MYQKNPLLLCRKIPTSYHNKAFGRRFLTYTPASVGVFYAVIPVGESAQRRLPFIHFPGASHYLEITPQSPPMFHIAVQSQKKIWGITPSTKWLKENISYASFDDELWNMLQNDLLRKQLGEEIIQNKIKK